MSRHASPRPGSSRASSRPGPRRPRDDVALARARVEAVLAPVPAPVPEPPTVPWTLPPEPPAPTAGAPAAEPGVVAALRAGRLGLSGPGAAGLVGVAVLCCLVAVLVASRGRPQPVAAPQVERAGEVVAGTDAALEGGEPEGVAPSPPVEVVVAVSGDVARPGLVRLPPGSRVDDALAAAGGLLPASDAGALNLARVLVDGEQVLVGAAATAAPAPAPGGAGATPGPVDLNAATAADLDALPGIGPVLAERIIAWRTREGAFRSVEQLREVEGIGPATWAELRDLVRV